MLQALLALAFVIAFLPVFVKKLEERNASRENAAIASQIAFAENAARAFVFDNVGNFPDGVKVFEDEAFVRSLEPYGLPLGFVPRGIRGGKISLIISKLKDDFFAAIALNPGKISAARRAEILARIGFWGFEVKDDGTIAGATGGWSAAALPNDIILNPNDIMVRVPEDAEFSELVLRRAKDSKKNSFHTNLDMGGNNIVAVRAIAAAKGEIKSVSSSDFLLTGAETDRKNRNEIGGIRADKAWFSASDGNPLTIVRGDLKTGTFSSASIANYGDAPNMTAKEATVKDFHMTGGHSGFNGPAHWEIGATARLTNIILSVDRISLSSYLDTSRGQNAYLSADGSGGLEYAAGSGVKANVIKTDNIVMRDQISAELVVGGTGRALLEIRPGGTTSLPDALLAGIDNDLLRIPLNPGGNDGRLESCRSIIANAGGRYNAASLASNLACQFVMYNRIERRIDIKKCLMAGGAKCD